MTNLDSILKSRDITLSTKVHLVKAMVFPVVMYGYESWTIKKAECRRTDAFELWCWRRLLRVPWTARRSNQSILKEISPGCTLEGLMLKLKLQYFGHCGAARAGRRPRPGFRFPLKWWDSPPPSGNLEPADRYVPSKKQRESWKARERPSLKKARESLGQ